MAPNPIQSSVPQALFDLRASFDNRQISDVFKAWESSEKTPAVAKRLLEPFCVEGTVVLSDSCGLSKLSKERPLADVLALVQSPKECLYAYGAAVGGVGIGIWAADNTATFYRKDIPIRTVLSALGAAKKAMADETVRVGIGVRKGIFYRVGDSFYGKSYADIDEVAENMTSADEIVVGEKTHAELGNDAGFAFSKREDLAHIGNFYRVDRIPTPDVEPLELGTYHFSLPFPARFHSFLAKHRSDPDPKRTDAVMRRYSETKTVVLAEIRKPEDSEVEIAILEGISRDFELRKAVRKTLRRFGGKELKTGGGISILVFDDTGNALGCSAELKTRLADSGLDCRIGIERSDVLLFNLWKRGYEIAGTAVNVASKLAQDYGEFGFAYASAGADVPDDWKSIGTPFVTKISNVELRGWKW